MKPISDKDAKKIFLKSWPKSTTIFSYTGEMWVQCRPKRDEEKFRGIIFPYLHTAGAIHFWIDPDSFYARLTKTNSGIYCDVICAEVCNGRQNFQEKRGKYAFGEAAHFVFFPRPWLEAPLESIKKCGEYLFPEGSEWDVDEGDHDIPVRTIRVMYFLEPDYFGKHLESIDPRAWEYFLPNTSIGSISAKYMRTFLNVISPDSHFYGWG